MTEIENLPGEEWREIGEAPGYWVSNMGRVRSKRGKFLKPVPNNCGYPRITLYGGKRVGTYLHTLVLETFVGPRPANMQVRHLNGNRADPRLSNLAYGTAQENRADRIGHGTDSTCDEHGCAKLTWEQVEIIRAAYDARTDPRNWGARRLAAEFGVDNTTVSKIARRKIWKKESPHASQQTTLTGE